VGGGGGGGGGGGVLWGESVEFSFQLSAIHLD
jgi:hypothetical protein